MSANLHKRNTANSLAQLQVCFGGFSDAGTKAQNQDAFAGLVPNADEVAAKGVVAAIADGVSSASKAAEAAQISVTQFISDYYATSATWATPKSASKVLNSLNQWLYSQSEQSNQWLTTFSALIIKSATGYIFHVGDSRISLFRDGELEAITRDHNRKRSGQHVVLTRALGADHRLKVDVHQVSVKNGDIYLLSCDGVHDFLSASAIKATLADLASEPTSQELEAYSQRIVEKAIEQGSNDNVSCLLVHVDQISHRGLSEIERDLLAKVIPPVLENGTKLDGYTICKQIHASIRSHLYLALDPQTNEKCVLKVPSQNFAEDIIYLQGFKREAWLGERIKHRHIMSVKSAPQSSHFLYHVCEYIEGQTLRQWMHDNPKPNIARVRDIIEQIILGLRAFQRLDVIHRDLKPDNIMIDTFDKVSLIDYGTVFIASLDENADTVKESVPQGSLNYIAPETLLNMECDHKSDLFSLGVIAYEMLCSELPFTPMRRAEVNFSHYHQWQYRPITQYRNDLPVWTDIALSKATAADPAMRFQAYSELQADINKPNVSALAQYKQKPIMQRNPVQFWQSVSLMLCIALIVAIAN